MAYYARMAYVRKRPNDTWECRVVSKLIPRPNYSTHDDEESARSYGRRLEAVLKSGRVPQELLANREDPRTPITRVLRDYLNTASLAPSDRLMAEHLQENLSFEVESLTVKWVDEWVKTMKVVDRSAPGTIRKKVECLARAVDWWSRREHTSGHLPANPLRTLPRGYSSYGESDGERVVDETRDRRLFPGESAKIEGVILGEGDRPMSIAHKEAFLLLYLVLVNTGLRLREAYTLTPGDVQFDLRTIHVKKSKTGKKRDVPLTPQVFRWLKDHKPKGGLIFPFWNGESTDLHRTTTWLSTTFGRVFEHAGCVDLRTHDLRHEAVCRWMLMRDQQGRWVFRSDEVMKITGHKTQAQFARYLSLRGSDLADRLWENQ